MAYAGARVSKLERRCFPLTTSSKFATCCKARTPVRELLDIWPLLPIVVKVYGYDPWDEGNVIAALEHNDRVCDFHLARVPSAQLEKVLAVVQQPFPALTRLQLGSQDGRAPVIPGSFLGGYTPRLQSLVLDRIPFPGLPTLLLSITHLFISTFGEFLIPGIFHPRRWSLACPH